MAETDARFPALQGKFGQTVSTVSNGLKNGREHLRGIPVTGLAQGLFLSAAICKYKHFGTYN